jgi:prepilin-type N-terminal cleavage/methylation domain-containing protein/prepilin-type processing-associated H-X9-DG protein
MTRQRLITQGDREWFRGPPSVRQRPPLHGFTLVELLVVITIIGILIALLLPAVQAAREAARRMQCTNNFKQAALALHGYHEAKGCFPPGVYNPKSTAYSSAPYFFGWSVYILPYLELDNIYDLYTFSNLIGYADKTGTTKNSTASATQVQCYLCPSDPTEGEGVTVSTTASVPKMGMTNICGVSDSTRYYYTVSDGNIFPSDFPTIDGIFGANVGCRIADIKDGTTNTLMLGEVAGSGKGQYSSRFWASWNIGDFSDSPIINGPTSLPGGATSFSIKTIGFSSFHGNGCNFAMADGSVAFVSQNTEDAVMKALATRDGGNKKNYTTPVTEVVVSGPP